MARDGPEGPLRVTDDKFVTPGPLPTPREREILTCLIEECAEVTQRATKAIRFGLGETQPGHTLTNLQRLSSEVGDLLGMVDLATRAGLVDSAAVEGFRLEKPRRFERYAQTAPEWIK